MIPGDNLFLDAIELIGTSTVQWYRATGRTTNAIGYDVTTYAAAVDIEGSIQAVDRTVYQQYGLDMQKNYVMFYTANDLTDIHRDVSGDNIALNGKRYQLTTEKDWFFMDGWTGVMCVEIGNA